MLDTNLDPFGNGNLEQSFVFNGETGANLQGTNAFTGDLNYHTDGIGEHPHSLLTHLYPAPSLAVTTNGHGIVGDMPCTLVYWFNLDHNEIGTARKVHEVSWGGDGNRYNAQIYVEYNGSTHALKIKLDLHKRGESVTWTSASGFLTGNYDKWWMVSLVYSSIRDETELYLDVDINPIITIPLTMKWLDNPIEVAGLNGTLGSNAFQRVDQFMTFPNHQLDNAVNRQVIYDMNLPSVVIVPTTPETLTFTANTPTVNIVQYWVNVTPDPYALTFTPNTPTANIVQYWVNVTPDPYALTFTPNDVTLDILIRWIHIYAQPLVLTLSPNTPTKKEILPTSDENTVDPFNDGSGMYLVKFDGNYVEESGLPLDYQSNAWIFQAGKWGQSARSDQTASSASRSWGHTGIHNEYTITSWLYCDTALHLASGHPEYNYKPFSVSGAYVNIYDISQGVRDYWFDGNSGNSGAVVMDGWNFIVMRRGADNQIELLINDVSIVTILGKTMSGTIGASPYGGSIVEQARVFNKWLSDSRLQAVKTETYNGTYDMEVEVISSRPTPNTPTVVRNPPLVFDPIKVNDRDPFGDGSGRHRWTFEGNFGYSGNGTVDYASGLFDYSKSGKFGNSCMRIQNVLDQGYLRYDLSADISGAWTVTGWAFFDRQRTFDEAPRYRARDYELIDIQGCVTVTVRDYDSNSEVYPVTQDQTGTVAVYKSGGVSYVNFTKSDYIPTYQEWIFWRIDRDLTGTLRVFINDILIYTTTGVDDYNGLIEMYSTYGNYRDHMRVFDGVLSDERVNLVRTEFYDFPVPADIQPIVAQLLPSGDVVTRGGTRADFYKVDAFGDGSGIHLWNFEDGLVQDEGISTVTEDTGQFLFKHGLMGDCIQKPPSGTGFHRKKFDCSADPYNQDYITVSFFAKIMNWGGDTIEISQNPLIKVRILDVAESFNDHPLEFTVEGVTNHLFGNATYVGHWYHYIIEKTPTGWYIIDANNHRWGGFGTGATADSIMYIHPSDNIQLDQIRVFKRALSYTEKQKLKTEQFFNPFVKNVSDVPFFDMSGRIAYPRNIVYRKEEFSITHEVQITQTFTKFGIIHENEQTNASTNIQRVRT